jgi:hypothetical protein
MEEGRDGETDRDRDMSRDRGRLRERQADAGCENTWKLWLVALVPV